MYTTHIENIYPGVALTCVITDKFKTGSLSVSFVTGLERNDAALSALLPRVLRRGCEGHTDIFQISSALDNLYGARIEPIIRKKGELHCIGFYCDFPDDRYLPHGGIFEKTAELLGRILLSPDMHGAYLRSDYVDSEKTVLIDDIHAAINEKSGYVIDRLVKEMCSDEAFGVNKLGGESEVLAVTPETLTAHHRKLLSCSPIEIFYCGIAEPERVEQAVRSSLNTLPTRSILEAPATHVISKPFRDTPRIFSEELDISQGKLAIGYRLGREPRKPLDFPALMVFNSIFGSGANSKLFLNVREKLSLCYYISSVIERHKEILIVSSGVDFAMFDKATDEINNQLNCIKNGDFSRTDLATAKCMVVSAFKAAFDRPEGLEGLYFDSRIASSPYDPVLLCEKVDEVTDGDIVTLASGIMTDSIFCLTGRKGDADNEA